VGAVSGEIVGRKPLCGVDNVVVLIYMSEDGLLAFQYIYGENSFILLEIDI
jgi:hypothetical protein